MSGLKRCPFCGGEAKISMFIGNPFVTCTECMGSIFPNVGQSKEEAIKAWNTRKPMERIVERLEERTEYFKDCTKYGNETEEQEERSYSTMMMYEVAYLVDDLIEIVKEEGGV